MKGVILAGGLGTRLSPLTLVTNKHLLPVYNKPMIYYPIQTLLDAEIDEILIVTGGPFAGHFLQLLGNGKQLGINRLHYTYQKGEGGIADALKLAEDFSEGERICVILGDNIFEPMNGYMSGLTDEMRKVTDRAYIVLKEVSNPERFGVPKFDRTGTLESIIEKPSSSLPSKFAVTGLYVYPNNVFSKIRNLVPSERGELEITDINNDYLKHNKMSHSISHGWWTDAGTFDSLQLASKLIKIREEIKCTTNC